MHIFCMCINAFNNKEESNDDYILFFMRLKYTDKSMVITKVKGVVRRGGTSGDGRIFDFGW